MQLGHAAHVSLVDDRLVRLIGGAPLPAPIETRIRDGRQRREWCAVPVIEGEIPVWISDLVPEQLVRPFKLAADHFRVRIQEHLVRIETQPHLGFVGPVNAVPV